MAVWAGKPLFKYLPFGLGWGRLVYWVFHAVGFLGGITAFAEGLGVDPGGHDVGLMPVVSRAGKGRSALARIDVWGFRR